MSNTSWRTSPGSARRSRPRSSQGDSRMQPAWPWLPLVAHRQGQSEGEPPARRVARQHDRALERGHDRAGVLQSSRMGMLGGQAIFGQHHPAARLRAQVCGPPPNRARRADAVAAAVEVEHRRLRNRLRARCPDRHHLGGYPAQRLPGDRGPARQPEGPGELVQPRPLHPPGQGRVETAPAELARARAHHRGRHPQRRASATDRHAALAVVAACAGMTRYAARSKRRTRYRYRNV